MNVKCTYFKLYTIFAVYGKNIGRINVSADKKGEMRLSKDLYTWRLAI